MKSAIAPFPSVGRGVPPLVSGIDAEKSRVVLVFAMVGSTRHLPNEAETDRIVSPIVSRG